MVTLIEAVGYWAIAWGSHAALPFADMVDRHNERFAHRVDAKHSCWNRVGGTEGEYGKPENGLKGENQWPALIRMLNRNYPDFQK